MLHLALLDAVRDAIFLADIDTGMIVDANRAAESMCGRSVAELRSLHHTQLHPPERAESASRSFCQNARVPAVIEGLLLHKDGRRIPVEVSSSHFTDPDGRRMLIGVFRDTTERNAAREELRRSEERFRQVAETVGEFIWEVDASGLYLYASPVVEQILGYTPEDLVGRVHFYDLFTPETRDELKRAAFEAFARQEPFRALLNWNVRKDGRIVALETSGLPVRDASGKLLGYCGADTDVTERKRAEEALRQSEKIYRAIGESIDYGVWVCAPDGRNTYTSDSFLKLVGLTQEQCSSFGWGDVLHPDDAERTIAAWKECVRQQGRWDAEHRFRGADGEWHPVLARGVPVRDEEGRITCWAGINLDISALKRTQESLRESEARARARVTELQAIMDAAPAAIFISHDAECRHISGNRAAYALMRQQPGGNLSMSAPNGERPASLRLLRGGVEIPPDELPVQFAVLTGQPVRNWELQVAFSDGASVDLLGNVEPLFDDNGHPRGAVAVLSDITERKRAEAALRESADRLALILEATSGGVWDWNIQTGDAVFSPRYSAMLGYEPEEFANNYKLWKNLVHPDDIERVRQHHADHFAGRTDFSIEFRMREKSGNWHWIHSRGLLIERDAAGNPLRMVGTHSSIQERKRAEEEQERLRSQLAHAQKMECVGRFAGGIAHDFNNLMSVILLHGDTALEELSSGESATASVMAMQEAAHKAIALTRQLMAFSHKQVLQFEVLALNSVIAQGEKLVQRLIGEDIQLVFIPGSGLGLVKADRSQLDQIIFNLAVNSRDAMPNGGSLTIETANVDLDEADARRDPAAKPGSYVMLAVRDTGVGMDKETQARVFEPFFTTKEVGKGTGLGLSVVYGIVKQSNGFITVHSEPGHGTEFRIYLPAVAETSKPSKPVFDTEGAPVQRGFERILLTEDEPSLREKLCELLENAGYQVLVARDGDEAYRLALQDTQPLHLLLTDVVIPGMSGPRLAGRLQPLRPEMKVLYMSGYADAGEASSALQSDLSFIEKPFTQAKLLRRLRDLLDGSRP